MVTMSSFVVMIYVQCMFNFHEKRSEENRNTIIYVIMKKNFKHWIVNIIYFFIYLRISVLSGSVWELYLLLVKNARQNVVNQSENGYG